MFIVACFRNLVHLPEMAYRGLPLVARGLRGCEEAPGEAVLPVQVAAGILRGIPSAGEC